VPLAASGASVTAVPKLGVCSTPRLFHDRLLGRVVLVAIVLDLWDDRSDLGALTAPKLLALICSTPCQVSSGPTTAARGYSRNYALGIRSYTHNASSCHLRASPHAPLTRSFACELETQQNALRNPSPWCTMYRRISIISINHSGRSLSGSGHRRCSKPPRVSFRSLRQAQWLNDLQLLSKGQHHTPSMPYPGQAS
jgi:hypothetical protein